MHGYDSLRNNIVKSNFQIPSKFPTRKSSNPLNPILNAKRSTTIKRARNVRFKKKKKKKKEY